MGVVERVEAALAIARGSGMPQQMQDDLRALLALVRACEAVESAGKAAEEFDHDYWGTEKNITVAEYVRQSGTLEEAHVAAVEALRTALAAVTRGE